MSEDATRGESRDKQIKEFGTQVGQLQSQVAEVRAIMQSQLAKMRTAFMARLEHIEKTLKN